MDELIQNCPVSENIGDNLIRAWAKINSPLYDNIVCSVSGGSDSDVSEQVPLQNVIVNMNNAITKLEQTVVEPDPIEHSDIDNLFS